MAQLAKNLFVNVGDLGLDPGLGNALRRYLYKVDNTSNNSCKYSSHYFNTIVGNTNLKNIGLKFKCF